MIIRIVAKVVPRPRAEKKYTLEEIGRKICASHGECTEKCVGFPYCRKGRMGAIAWLRTIVEEEK